MNNLACIENLACIVKASSSRSSTLRDASGTQENLLFTRLLLSAGDSGEAPCIDLEKHITEAKLRRTHLLPLPAGARAARAWRGCWGAAPSSGCW